MFAAGYDSGKEEDLDEEVLELEKQRIRDQASSEEVVERGAFPEWDDCGRELV